jgi:hypothetical protein
MHLDEALSAEAIRIYRRYAVEIVEQLRLCPWAEHARKSGHVSERVLLGRSPDCRSALEVIAEHAPRSEVEILLLIFPRLALDRQRFEHFVAELREADSQRHRLGDIPFAMAAFHPDAAPELDAPERLIPFLRRTPDPTIQLVRRSVLERVRERAPEGTGFFDLASFDSTSSSHVEAPSLRERIAAANHQTVVCTGVGRIEARLADICRDRDRSYARVLGAANPG